MGGEQRVRARELGIEIGTLPVGRYNAITDVVGVEVGHATVHWGKGDLPVGQGPARSGVTAIWPQPKHNDLISAPLAAGFFALSGTGEMTGRSEIEELGRINTPIVLTNTMSVGLAYDATCRYLAKHDPRIGPDEVVIPVVAECDDSYLNDSRGFHVTAAHVEQALDNAQSGEVAEGCVGAGTGMHLFGYKGGIGTSSRVLPTENGGWTIGVLVLTNFGRRPQLTISGVPAGLLLERGGQETPAVGSEGDEGSGIVVVATDAPLDGRQLARVAKRAALGLGRTGSTGGNSSGELLVAFSTGYRPGDDGVGTRAIVEGGAIDLIFTAAVDATEEAVLNALFMATTTTGRLGRVEEAIPIEQVRTILQTYGRISR